MLFLPNFKSYGLQHFYKSLREALLDYEILSSLDSYDPENHSPELARSFLHDSLPRLDAIAWTLIAPHHVSLNVSSFRMAVS